MVVSRGMAAEWPRVSRCRRMGLFEEVESADCRDEYRHQSTRFTASFSWHSTWPLLVPFCEDHTAHRRDRRPIRESPDLVDAVPGPSLNRSEGVTEYRRNSYIQKELAQSATVHVAAPKPVSSGGSPLAPWSAILPPQDGASRRPPWQSRGFGWDRSNSREVSCSGPPVTHALCSRAGII